MCHREKVGVRKPGAFCALRRKATPAAQVRGRFSVWRLLAPGAYGERTGTLKKEDCVGQAQVERG